MKTVSRIILTLTILLISAGCESTPRVMDDINGNATALYKYLPTSIRITALTEFIEPDDSSEFVGCTVYIDAIDAFGSQIKTPGTFRFELYEFTPRSGRRKGQRLMLWKDIDLREPAKNNEYWREYLRAYQFNLALDFQPAKNQNYILQATCLIPSQKRLISVFDLQYK